MERSTQRVTSQGRVADVMLSNCSAERFCNACDLDRLSTVGLVQPYEHEGEAERSQQGVRKRTDDLGRFATGRQRGQRRDADQMVQTGAKSGNFVRQFNWRSHVTPEGGRAGPASLAVRPLLSGAAPEGRRTDFAAAPPTITIVCVRIMLINASPIVAQTVLIPLSSCAADPRRRTTADRDHYS